MPAIREPPLKHDVSSFHVTQVPQSDIQRPDEVSCLIRRGGEDDTDPIHLRGSLGGGVDRPGDQHEDGDSEPGHNVSHDPLGLG